MGKSAVPPLLHIISGGQTGVDRAALDVAMELGLSHGGWCPRGRLAEDGSIPQRYQLQETSSAEYPVRTQQNVLDSDGTLILFRDRLQGGTLLTFQLAQRLGKPCLLVDLEQPPHPDDVRRWLEDYRIRVLNIAGPRESSVPGITSEAAVYLRNVLGTICTQQQNP